MNKHIKKTVLALCYVLSIFTALMIVRVRLENSFSIESGRESECKQSTKKYVCPNNCGHYNECVTVQEGTGADSCNSAANRSCYFPEAGQICNDPTYIRDSAGLTYSECNAEAQ